MTIRLLRRVQLPPDPRSLTSARALLRSILAEVGLESLSDVALLLTTEVCASALKHAGTELELAVSVEESELTVTVTDRGPTRLGPTRAGSRVISSRVITDGSLSRRGLQVLEELAAAWGTRHDLAGRHQVWFCLTSSDAPVGADPPEPPAPPLSSEVAPGNWPGPRACRWLLHMPGPVTARLDVPTLVTELLRRLCDVLGATEASVWLDYGDGPGEQLLAWHGRAPDSGGQEHPAASQTADVDVIDVQLTLDAPLRGRLQVHRSAPTVADQELATLSAHRIALAIESDWLRGIDRRRRSWMTFLAETSELLAQSLNVNFTVALVPQIVVPRLGNWCAVHLINERGHVVPAAWGHADEFALPPLRSWLDGEGATSQGALRPWIDLARQGTRPVTFTAPVEGVSVPLIARSATLGTLTVGRPERRSHTPEDVALICDVARRASLAIANAQLNAANVAVSQAFQRALLPRALPVAEQVEFAAAYLSASAGTDVGGDFYDVLALPEDRWLVAVGDVCGKGAPAAARTGRVRDVLRTLVRDGCQLERAIRLLNEAMGEPVDEQQFCTLAGALISNRANGPGLDVELVLAGQDQPLLLCADGSITFLGEFGTAVGLLNDMQLCTTRHCLLPGDAIVFYTDGVTERRNGNEFFGRTRLTELATRLVGAPAATMAAALRTAAGDFSPDPPKDDIALLVVKAR